MFRPLLLMTLLLGCSSLGCGLREQAFAPDGGLTGGAGKGGRGGTGGGRGGTGGGHPTDAGGDVPACTDGSGCTPANACHVGQTVCSVSGDSCMDTQWPQANGTDIPLLLSVVASMLFWMPCSTWLAALRILRWTWGPWRIAWASSAPQF